MAVCARRNLNLYTNIKTVKETLTGTSTYDPREGYDPFKTFTKTDGELRITFIFRTMRLCFV